MAEVVHVEAAVAQVPRGRERRVVEVLRVGDPVTVAVAGVLIPGRGDELHRPDGAVVHGVAVESAAVGVRDGGLAREAAVEGQADHRFEEVALLVALPPLA